MTRFSPFRATLVVAGALFAAVAHAAPALPGGGYMVFAVGYGTDGRQMDNYVQIGEYTFGADSVTVNYMKYEANSDRLPSKAPPYRQELQAPYGTGACENKVIEIPTMERRAVEQGQWQMENEAKFEVTLGGIDYEWVPDSTGGTDAYTLARAVDVVTHKELPLAVGYAYAGKKRTDLAPLGKRNFLRFYNGEIFHKDNTSYAPTPWKPHSSGLKVGDFVERENGNVLSFSSPGSAAANGAWVGNSILLNYEARQPLLMYEDLGHDFNKNGCYDEFGHNKVMLGVADDEGPILSRIVYIEYSYTFKGFPMLSVGRYHR